MAYDKGGGQVGQRESGVGGEFAERTNGLELGPVGRNVQVECLGGDGRWPRVGSARPDNHPLLSGP